jgi:uncharacterized membrane protein
MKKIWEYILAGILFIVPFTISVWILYKIFIFLNGIIGNIVKKFIPAFYVPGIGIILLILILLFFGFLAKNVIGKKLFQFLNALFRRIPFLNKIYYFVKIVVENILSPNKKAFKDVVLVEFPGKDAYMLGFITGNPPKEIEEKTPDKQLVNVFVPIPNSFFIMKDASELKKIDISIEDAFKLIFSAGVFKKDENKKL